MYLLHFLFNIQLSMDYYYFFNIITNLHNFFNMMLFVTAARRKLFLPDLLREEKCRS